MNIAVLVVLALVAVSQAAFTTSLVKDAQPVLAQGMLKIRLSSRNAAAQKDLAAIIQSHANDILSQIEGLVNAGFQIAEAIHSHLASTIAQLQSTSNGKIEPITTTIITAAVGSAVGSAVTNVWNWLFGKNLGFIGNLVDVVSSLSITDILNTLANYATGLISQLGLGSLLQYALEQIVPKPLADLFTNQPGFARGFFGDLWGSVSSAALNAWDHVSEVASSLYEAAYLSFAQVQQLATQFASNAWTEASVITSDAAQQFLAFLKPYQQDLGALHDQITVQLGQIVSK